MKPEKPVEAPKEEKNTETIVYEAPKPLEPTPRPTDDQPLVELKRSIAPSLITALENLKKTATVNTQGIHQNIQPKKKKDLKIIFFWF